MNRTFPTRRSYSYTSRTNFVPSPCETRYVKKNVIGQFEAIAGRVWPIPRTRSLALSTRTQRASAARMHAHTRVLRPCTRTFTRYTHTRTKVGGEGGGGGRPAWLYMWAKNDTLAKVTSCEVSPVCRRLHWLAVSQLLRCGNDVAGALYGWLAG